MNWFVWRQHRKQFMIFGVLLAIFAIFAIFTGNNFWHTYQNALHTCAQNPATPSCSDLQDNLFTSSADGFIRIAVVLATFGLPVLAGLFIGSPLIAREYEEDTNKLAWTQSVSRRKWLTTKLLWALGFAFVYGVIVASAATWWSHTLDALTQYRFIQGHFETQGLMPVAYSMFFTAFGFMIGAWFRKTIIGFAVTFGMFVLCMASFAQLIRPHYMRPVAVTSPMGPNAIEAKIPAGAWVLKRNIVDKNGHGFDSFRLTNMPADCRTLIEASNGNIRVKAGPTSGDPIDVCLNKAGFHQTAQYQPAYRYWDFQRIEAGIYAGMTALAVAATYWVVLRRDA